MYDRIITIEEIRNDFTASEMLDLFENLLLAATYHPNSIKQAIVELAEEYKDEENCINE